MRCPKDFLQQKVFNEKVVWSVICIKTPSSVLYFVLIKKCRVMTQKTYLIAFCLYLIV